jgi:hypothetical protein
MFDAGGRPAHDPGAVANGDEGHRFAIDLAMDRMTKVPYLDHA